MTPDVTLIVSTPECGDRSSQCEPVTVGVPLPRGMVHDPRHLSLVDGGGRLVPVQVASTDTWSDGSLRWVLLDFQVAGPIVPERRYTLRIDDEAEADREAGLLVTEESDQITVGTGTATFVLRTGTSFPFVDVAVGGLSQLDPSRTALRVTDEAGRCHAASLRTLTVEERGALRVTVKAEGTIGLPRGPMLLVIARLQFFRGLSAVRVALTLRNPRRARHRNGYWELGDPGSVHLKDASVCLGLAGKTRQLECSTEPESPPEIFQDSLELYQDSSGGENWCHVNHVNRRGRVPASLRGYRLISGSRLLAGLRATPAVRLQHQHGSLGLVVEHFWQNCPKAIEAEPRALIYRFFPEQYADTHELQGGEQKTHRFTLMFGPELQGHDDAWFWGRTPCRTRATPSWYCQCAAVPYLSCSSEASDPRYEALIRAGIEGPDAFERKREIIDEYGWRHFGDLYADHENAYSHDPQPIVSHYNNQYDAIAGFATQFMRTGDWRWHSLCCDLATHVYDIDIYHTERDKSAYNGGLFWHTAHYAAAGAATHRSYPNSPGVAGGGLSNEHNYASGLMLHYFLTGDPISRESAIGLARWVIAMDDGSKTAFRWLSRSPTGLASHTNAPDFHGPGRGAGHSLRALLDGHRLTREAAFLDKAEELLRRVVHPSDDVAALELLDAERRWSYTAFLQALASYLDYKVELGAIDQMYGYGVESLLNYARWMLRHESPYLDRPDTLEYPTETWAAQDIRKSDVFYAASQHANDEREAFRERGAFFFESAVSTLAAARTRSFTRPIVILLSNGRLHEYRELPAEPGPSTGMVTHDMPGPTHFVSQKHLAKQRLRRIAYVGLGFVTLAIPLALLLYRAR